MLPFLDKKLPVAPFIFVFFRPSSLLQSPLAVSVFCTFVVTRLRSIFAKRNPFEMLPVLSVLLSLFLIFGRGLAAPSPPEPCGTLDLTHPSTQHCFPADASHHFVCCTQIQTVGNPNSPHGNLNPLESAIRGASNSSNYSWCTCSQEVCTKIRERFSRATYQLSECLETLSPLSRPLPFHVQICTEQLGGVVAWNMNGLGWKSFRPRAAFGLDLPAHQDFHKRMM